MLFALVILRLRIMSVLLVADNLTPNPFPSGKGNRRIEVSGC